MRSTADGIAFKGNEVGCRQASGDATLAIGKEFKQVLKRLDPIATRPMTGAWKNWPGNRTMDTLWAEQVVDVYGVNYFSPSGYDSFHNSSPGTPMVASEHCSCTSDRTPFANATAGMKGTYSAWPCIKDCWEPVANRSFVQGLFDWTGYEKKISEGKPFLPENLLEDTVGLLRPPFLSHCVAPLK